MSRYAILDFHVDNDGAVFDGVLGPFKGDAEDARQRCDRCAEDDAADHVFVSLMEDEAQEIFEVFHDKTKS